MKNLVAVVVLLSVAGSLLARPRQAPLPPQAPPMKNATVKQPSCTCGPDCKCEGGKDHCNPTVCPTVAKKKPLGCCTTKCVCGCNSGNACSCGHASPSTVAPRYVPPVTFPGYQQPYQAQPFYAPAPAPQYAPPVTYPQAQQFYQSPAYTAPMSFGGFSGGAARSAGGC